MQFDGWRSFGSLYKKVYGFRGETVLITGPTLTSCLVTKFHPAKKILDVHFCHQEGWFNQIKWKLFYWLFGSDYDTIIFHSPFVQHEAEQLAPWLGYKYQTILYSTDFYGIPTPDERTAARRHFGLTEDAFVIGNAGWLIDRKRFDVFLETCSEVIKQYPNVLCLIAGDGPQKETLQKLSQKLGIEKNVEFLGWQEDLHLFYKSLNLLLFNSNSDAFGRTVMESMGYGIPVVASVVEGGTDAVIKQGKNGYLLQRHDIALLSKYCLQLISNSDLYKTFQEAAIETIQREFSTQRYVNDYLKIFGQTDNCNIENAA